MPGKNRADVTTIKLEKDVAARLEAFRNLLDRRNKGRSRRAGLRSIPRPLSMSDAVSELLYRTDKHAQRSRAAKQRKRLDSADVTG